MTPGTWRWTTRLVLLLVAVGLVGLWVHLFAMNFTLASREANPLHTLLAHTQSLWRGMSLAHTQAALKSQSRLDGDIKCAPDEMVVRREWASLAAHERQAYVDAVLCTMKTPSVSVHYGIHAARSLYDDFVAVHVTWTPATHFSAIFLHWHRHFTWAFEEALHECGYPQRMGIPYWNWALPVYHEEDGLHQALFADDTIGGLGIDSAGTNLSACVPTGPFANVSTTFPAQEPWGGPASDWLQTGRPGRCVRRRDDFTMSQNLLRIYLNQSAVDDVLAAPTLDEMQFGIAGRFNLTDGLGLHGWAHFIVGGHMWNPWTSPVDPVFYLHHSMVDRVWSLWQATADPTSRRFALPANTSNFRQPDSPANRVDNDTLLHFSPLVDEIPAISMAAVADPEAGLYCYRYE